MKTVILNSLAILLISWLFSGCTAPVYFEKTLPPEIQTGAPNPTAAFVNRYDYTLPGTVSEKYRDCYQLGASELTRDMKDVFGQSELLKISTVDTLLPGIARSYIGTPLSPDSVIKMCREYNTPFLLVLESMNFWVTGEKAGGDEENSKLLSLKLQDVYLVLKAGISLYGSSGNLLHQDSISYRTLYKTRLSLTADVWLFEPNLKKSGPSIIILAKDMAKEYYKNLLPRSVREIRTLFVGKGFSEVRRCFAREDWDEAIRLMLPMTGSPDQKLADQAAYNLSVMYEIKGNMAQSDFWLNKSGGKKPQEVVTF